MFVESNGPGQLYVAIPENCITIDSFLMLFQPLIELTQCQLATGRSAANIKFFIIPIFQNSRGGSGHTIGTDDVLALNFNNSGIHVPGKFGADVLIHQIIEMQKRLVVTPELVFFESFDNTVVGHSHEQGATLGIHESGHGFHAGVFDFLTIFSGLEIEPQGLFKLKGPILATSYEKQHILWRLGRLEPESHRLNAGAIPMENEQRYGCQRSEERRVVKECRL